MAISVIPSAGLANTQTLTTLQLTNPLGTAYGGTALSSFTANGVVYASSTSALATGSAITFDGTNAAFIPSGYTAIGGGGGEAARATSNKNFLVGTTTDFTTTTAAGGVAMAGYGIYPYTSTGGATNTTIYSGFNLENATLAIDGSASTQLSGAVFVPKVSNTGSGGTGQISAYGISALPKIPSSGANARLLVSALQGNVFREYSTDLSAYGTIYGFRSSIGHSTTAGSGISTGQMFGCTINVQNQNGTVTTGAGFNSTVLVGTQSGAPATTVSSLSSFNSLGISIGQATGNTATVTSGYGINLPGPTVAATGTVTNYYGVYLGAASVTGTLTNNWGVYVADTVAKNYFGGTVGVGTTSPASSAILDAQSTTQGVRFPNMTTTQKNAISSPAAGLVVFDTTLAKLCVYTGAAWQTITSA